MGVLAVAFVTVSANGIQPGQCRFNQDSMRRYLYKHLTIGEMSMFPHKPSWLVKSIELFVYLPRARECNIEKLGVAWGRGYMLAV